MVALLIPVAFFLMFLVIIEGSHISVYGRFLPEDKISALLADDMEQLRLNSLNTDIMMHFPPSKFFYVSIANSVFSKWHIADVGCISRWSPWSRKLDDRRRRLIEAGSDGLI